MAAGNYCTNAEIASFMQIAIDGASTPSDTEVDEFIHDAEEEIDSHTDHAWQTARQVTITDEPANIEINRNTTFGYRGKINLRHYDVIASTNDLASGALKVWNGSTYTDYVAGTQTAAAKTDPLSGDYWIDFEKGYIYLKTWATINSHTAPSGWEAYVTYKYGKSSTPTDIRKATILLASAQILQSTDFAPFKQADVALTTTSGISTNIAHQIANTTGQGQIRSLDSERIRDYERRAYKILNSRKRSKRQIIFARPPKLKSLV